MARQRDTNPGRCSNDQLLSDALGSRESCTCSRMALWNDIWRRLRKIWGRSFRQTREIGVRGCPSSRRLTEHHSIRPQARHPPAWCSGGSYVCAVTHCSGIPPPPDKEQSVTDNMFDLIDRLHSTDHNAPQHLKWASDKNEGLLRPPRKFHGIPETRVSLAVRSVPNQRNATQAPDIVGRPLQDDHPDQRRGPRNVATS
jgi:hypothetical protein